MSETANANSNARVNADTDDATVQNHLPKRII